MNIFLVLNILGLSPKESKLQMMYFDMHPDGPYKDFVGKVYAPWDGVVNRPSKYKNKQVCQNREYLNENLLFYLIDEKSSVLVINMTNLLFIFQLV